MSAKTIISPLIVALSLLCSSKRMTGNKLEGVVASESRKSDRIVVLFHT
jgi:hypothetical protein